LNGILDAITRFDTNPTELAGIAGNAHWYPPKIVRGDHKTVGQLFDLRNCVRGFTRRGTAASLLQWKRCCIPVKVLSRIAR
jgi:hypothetical protein